MKKALLISTLITIALVILCSCDTHSHTYESTWSYDEVSHWHNSTCGHGTDDKVAHSFISFPSAKLLVCTACGYETELDNGGMPSQGGGEAGGNQESQGGASANVSTEGTSAEVGACNVNIECISGTPNAYTIENNVVTFGALSEDSVYKISGELDGAIVIDIGEGYKLDLELTSFKISSSTKNPITVLSGDKISLTAKKDTENTVFDNREAIDETNEALYSGAIHSLCDLEICGKGALTVVSSNNSGIHSKDDLKIKNLTLCVSSYGYSIKGNDSVTFENATATVISKAGDGIKTTSSDISSKGNQRGDITVFDSFLGVYCACDGLDAAHNVIIDGESTEINIYTDKYSSYSESVPEDEGEVGMRDGLRFIRFSSDIYSYSIKYYNSDSDYLWVNAEYFSEASGSFSSYYYYSFPIYEQYSQFKFFMYDSSMEQGQESEYVAQSDYMTWNDAYDTFALSSRGGRLSYNWATYSLTVDEGFRPGGMGGPGGMQEGNSDKGTYSTKGIKASNEIIINAGKLYIKSYDDAIHASNDEALENGESPLGNVTVNGGTVIIYSNDDGLHADGNMKISGGDVSVINAYEGVEGYTVEISGGSLSVISTDDGINSTATSGTAIKISGGEVYIYARGDGIDANTRASYEGIVFSGGKTIVICNSNGNSSLDTEQGYKFEGGYVLAVGSSGGMSGESERCYNFSTYATTKSLSLSQGSYLTVNGGDIVTLKMPTQVNARVIFLSTESVSIDTNSSTDFELNSNGVFWNN